MGQVFIDIGFHARILSRSVEKKEPMLRLTYAHRFYYVFQKNISMPNFANTYNYLKAWLPKF